MNEKPSQEPETQTLEVVSADAIESIERAQIDMQVATAHRYPRSVKQFLSDAESMIAMDEETAESCNYKLKRKEKGGGMKLIEGPSIRLLEIAATAYGNLRFGSRPLAEDDRFVTVQGVAHDLQKNIAVSVEVKRRITTSEGKRYGDDMVGVTTMAASAIARRNALNSVIPRAYVNRLAGFAKKIAVGDIKTLPERRQRALEYFTKTLGIDLAVVLNYLERPSVQDCTLEDVATLQGLKTALKDGEAKIDDVFGLAKPDEKTAQAPKGGRKEAPSAPKAPEDDGDLGPQTGTRPDYMGEDRELAGETPAPQAAAPKPQDELADLVLSWGHTFDVFREWAQESGNLAEGEEWGSFSEIPKAVAARFVRAKAGLKKGLDAVKGGAQ